MTMTAKPDFRPIEILMVEDNPGDVDLTIDAFDAGKIRNRLSVVASGSEAMSFLRREGDHRDAPRPDLILLDLNLPGKGGLEVLESVKKDPELKKIPIVILTSSEAEKGVLRSYCLHANCYITKPVDFSGLAHVVGSVEDFWFSVVRLPPV